MKWNYQWNERFLSQVVLQGKVNLQRGYRVKNIWKILLSIIAVNIITLAACILGSFIYQNVHITNFSDMLSNTMGSDLGYALCNVIMTIFVYYFCKYIIKKEKIGFKDLGFSKEHKISQVLMGFTLGIVFVLIYVSILIAMGEVLFEYNPLSMNVFYSLCMGFIIFGGVAFAEEIIYRGYIQYILGKKNKYVGLIITAIVFALSHLLNANYSLMSLIYLTIGGVMLGLMRMKTRNIWFPLGFHIAWNWTEIRVFGLNNATNHRWFTTKIVKNTIWNGGESGTGIIIVLVELVFIAILLTYAKKKKSEN
jgi:membrane protease YdiL (CAAX protease family)